MNASNTNRPVPDALSIVVADMASALDFYSRCGLDFPSDAAEQPHTEATVGNFRIMFDTRAVLASFAPEWTPASGGPAMSLAFRCPSPGAVDATHADLVSAGYRSSLDPFDAPWGQRYASVDDPDGNSVDFYCPLD